MTRILIIEDEQRIASFVRKGLSAEGFVAEVAGTGATGLALAQQSAFDLVILDLGLPDIDGFEVLTQLRATGHRMPVIVLTARDSVTDTVRGLEGGADDYMGKPFSFAELLARVRLRIRREASPGDEHLLIVGGMQLDRRTRLAHLDGRAIELSSREYLLLETFMVNAGRVLSREQLLDQVWGLDFDPGSNVVDVYVGYLRKKLGTQLISTVRGMGYRLNR